MCGQAPVDVVAEPHQLGQAGHHDEDDGGGVGAEGGHQGARADRVLGKQNHLLHRTPLLSTCILLDLQVMENKLLKYRVNSRKLLRWQFLEDI